MKKLSTHHVHKVLAVAIVGLLFGVTYFVNPSFIKAPEVQAGTGENLSGFAWGENTGWISFNSSDCDTDGNGFVDSANFCGGNNTTTVARDYGVNVDTSTQGSLGIGLFSGHAWSKNIGWISFNQADITGICPSGATVAQVNWSTRKVSGWARALAGDTASGWDGCIKFSKDGVNPWTGSGAYDGVAFSANNLVGHAWGSDVIGWIDFAPTVGGNPIAQRVKLTAPSVASVTASVNGASSASVASGELFTLVMNSSGANSCKWSRDSTPSSSKDFANKSILASNGGPLQFNNNNNFIEAGPLSVTWTFTCTNSANGTSATASASLSITAPPVPGPWVSIIADPTTITSGGSSTLRWVSGGGVTSCTASDGWVGTKSTEGTQVVSPMISGTKYSINCTDGSTATGVKSAVVTVIAPPAPTPGVTLVPFNNGNGTYTLSWAISDFTNPSSVSCSSSPTSSWLVPGDGGTGDRTVTPSQGINNYPITCIEGGESAIDSVTITIGTPSCNNNGKCEQSNNENNISCPKDCATIGGTGTR